MNLVFVELPAFERHRSHYLDDDGFRWLQHQVMSSPDSGDVIEGTGGLRKLRFADMRRGKGKRSGLRVIYYWWRDGSQIWLFTLYDKDEMTDLTSMQRRGLKARLRAELAARQIGE